MVAEFLIVSESFEVEGVDVSSAIEGPSDHFVRGLIASRFCVNLSSTSSDSRMSLSRASTSVTFCWSSWFKVTRKFCFRVRCVATWSSLLMSASEMVFWFFSHDVVFNLILKPCSNAAVWSPKLFLHFKIGHLTWSWLQGCLFLVFVVGPCRYLFRLSFSWNLLCWKLKTHQKNAKQISDQGSLNPLQNAANFHAQI